MTGGWSNVRGMRIPVAVSVLFAAVANILTVVSVATDYWESVEYGALRRHGALSPANSYFDDRSGFYKVAVVVVRNESNASFTGIQTHFVRARHGGIWRVCDRIPGKNPTASAFGLDQRSATSDISITRMSNGEQ